MAIGSLMRGNCNGTKVLKGVKSWCNKRDNSIDENWTFFKEIVSETFQNREPKEKNVMKRSIVVVVIAICILISMGKDGYGEPVDLLEQTKSLAWYYNPGNPRFVHIDPNCEEFGSLYQPMMGIEEDNPIFIYMKKCPRCVSDNSDLKDDGFFPWLWSVEEKAQEMPDYYAVPKDVKFSIYDVTQNAIQWVKKHGDSPELYGVYTSYHRESDHTNQCYSVIFALPYQIDGSVFFDLVYEILIDPDSGEIIKINQGD